ncbi:MAG: hypothetical protein WD294_05200 [Phycisphaeraceae bacterium]
MTDLRRQTTSGRPTAPPNWVRRWLNDAPLQCVVQQSDLVVERADGPDARFVQVTVPCAAELAGLTLQRCVTRAYTALGEQIRQDGQVCWPVRFWNYVPDIQQQDGGNLNRYMIFNAGRWGALAEWYGNDTAFGSNLAAATALDVRSKHLVVQVLAATEPGEPVENARQLPAYRYSARYGPLPPCFARATVVNDALMDRWMLVSGTASVVGEASRHPCDIHAQLRETFANLATLAAPAGTTPEEAHGRYRSLRAYVTRKSDVPVVEAAVRRTFHALEELEIVPADLCRPELLVEIEGVAEAVRSGHAAGRARRSTSPSPVESAQ